MNDPLEDLKFPVGRFSWPLHVKEDEIRDAIIVIEQLPDKLENAVQNLSEETLDTPYRPGGWTIRQVVHHIADSHMNAFIRFKLALTENTPTIRPYDQAKWADLADSVTLPPDISIAIIKNVHIRWVVLMNCMTPSDWELEYIHPEYNKNFPLSKIVKMYAWHCEHHLAHITGSLERERRNSNKKE